MRRLTLKVFRSKDEICLTQPTICECEGKIDVALMEFRQNAKGVVAFGDLNGIGFNLDELKAPLVLLTFPQILLHEFLHFCFPGPLTAKLVHKVRRATRGLLL